MTAGEAVAAVFVLGVTIYAWTGMADFGAGFWDLAAGGRERGRRPRALLDTAIAPVWEANHVWLVFCIVTCWTAFGVAFASIMSTLYVPLTLAVLGIVLRGASFAFHENAARARQRHLAAWLFGAGSLVTPFFLGTAVGALLGARVPAGNAAGNRLTSWWNPTSVLVGLLAVALGALLAATYLIVEAQRRDDAALAGYFRRRALAAGAAAVALGLGALAALRADERQMFDRVTTGRATVALALATVALVAALVLVARRATRGARPAAIVAVGALVWTWGVAQYPYLLPFDLTIAAGSGAATTLHWVLVWFAVALVTAVPALVYLYVLDQRGELAEATAGPRSRP